MASHDIDIEFLAAPTEFRIEVSKNKDKVGACSFLSVGVS
jgi:hypothetical protein